MNRNKYKDRRLVFYLLFGEDTYPITATINIQIIDSSYKLSANNNVIKAVKLYPERGIYTIEMERFWCQIKEHLTLWLFPDK